MITWTMRKLKKLPYMAIRRGVSITRVLRRVEREKMVMAQSMLREVARLAQMARMVRTMSF